MYKTPMFDEQVLKDKTAIITGGGSGLGKSMASYFNRLGANVVITSRTKEKLDNAAEEMQNENPNGGKLLTVAGDVRDYTSVENVIAEAENEFGSVDILVNNAAGNFISPTEKLSHRAFESIIGIVLQGSINFTLATGKNWIEKEQAGTVLNIVTTYAWTGSGYVVPSACAKAGVLNLTRSLAVEWAKYNIRMNAIAPGPFPTKGAWDRLFPKALTEKFALEKKVPLKRVGEHQELANLAAYLVSDFSAYINGEVITIDGGEWLNGAGQFNMLENVPKEMWDLLEQQIRKAKNKKED